MTDVQQSGQSGTPLWAPSPARVAATEIERFRRDVRPEATDTDELWQWSVDEPGPFWKSVWDWSGIVGEPGARLEEPADVFRHHRFLPDATLNFAENLLADRGGSATAIIAIDENGSERQFSRQELREQTAAMASAFVARGVGPGDRVAAWMPHRVETIVAFLAASAIGAVFTSTSSDFGTDGVVDRFGQTEPKVLVAADGYRYGGREFATLSRLDDIVSQLDSVETVVVVGVLDERPDTHPDYVHWTDLMVEHQGAAEQYVQLPGDHPIYVLYSSGTTGKPKCIVHRAGGVLLKHMTEQRLHSDIRPDDAVFYFTTCGWMMWNWLVSVLATGATIVLYDGNPAYPSMSTLFELVEKHAISLFGVSAKFIDSVMKSGYRPLDHHDLASIRTICSTGSPLSQEGFAWVYDAISPEVHLASISGGTDLCGCLVTSDPTRPVFAGEIQAKGLGMDIVVLDDNGEPCPPGEKGELVCAKPFPSMPLEFWNDDNDLRYQAAYFERFDGVWAHGDYAAWTDNDGMIIYGRSDATLNASGVRIGTAEIYRVVERHESVAEAIAIAQEWDNDTRIVLFVKMTEPGTLSGEIVDELRRELRAKASPRHVPAVVLEVPDIPRTRSGKIVELAVTEVVHGRPVKNAEALANAEALKHFTGHRELEC